MLENFKIRVGCGDCSHLRRNARNEYFCDVDWVVGWFMFKKVSRNYEKSEEEDDGYTRDKRYGGIELKTIHSWRDMREDCDYTPISDIAKYERKMRIYRKLTIGRFSFIIWSSWRLPYWARIYTPWLGRITHIDVFFMWFEIQVWLESL